MFYDNQCCNGRYIQLINKVENQTYFPTHQNQGNQPLQSVSAQSYGLKLRHFTEYSVSWSTTPAMIVQLLIMQSLRILQSRITILLLLELKIVPTAPEAW